MTREEEYNRARNSYHRDGYHTFEVSDNQLEIWQVDDTGYWIITYSDIEMIENIELIAQSGKHTVSMPTVDHLAQLQPQGDMPQSDVSEVGDPDSVASETRPILTETTSPIFTQYSDIKKQFPEAILFFRLGDFYETFSEDAELVSRELDVVLTSRNISKTKRIPMAGIPHHAAENYIARLIEKGYHIAICEQTGDELIKGLIPREVVRVITPEQPDPQPPLPDAETVAQPEERNEEIVPQNRPTWDEMRRHALRAQGR